MKSDKVIELIGISERMYLGTKEATIPGQDWVRKHIKYPVLLVSKGFDFAKKEIIIYSVLYILGLFVTIKLLEAVPIETPIEIRFVFSSFFLNIVIFGPLFIVLFLPPSTYCASRVDGVIVKHLLQHLSEVDTKWYINILEIYEKQATRRISFIKKLYAFSWAIFVYLVNSINTSSIVETNMLVAGGLISIAFYMLILFLGFICIQAYSKSTDIIFNNVKVTLMEKNDL